jgi:hypothetical protein
MTRHRCPHRSPLLVLALGAVVGLAAGGGDPATAASGPDLPTLLGVAPVSRTVSALPVAPLVVPEPLAARAPEPATVSPGVPVASWQLDAPASTLSDGDVEGDPQAVAVPPSLEVAAALQRLRDTAGDETATGRRPGRAALVALDAALDQVGDPYVWGATGPAAFDCSGLTSWSYARAGVALPRVSRDQYAVGGEHVDLDELLPGDLVFFATAAWDPGVVHHVGMYVGGGLMVAAPRAGLTVRVEPVPAAAYVGAVRPVPDRGPAAADADDGQHGSRGKRDRASSRPPTAPTTPGPVTATAAPSAPAAPATTAPTGPTGPAPATPAPSAAATSTPEEQPTPSTTPTPAPSLSAAPTATATLSPTTTATQSPVGTATLVATPVLVGPGVVSP